MIIEDEFRGSTEHLRDCIKALIEMSDDQILIPHGLGGHARKLLASSYHRLAPATTETKCVCGFCDGTDCR